mgnify:FL=1
MFLIADYESIFLNKSTKRKDINPLDYRIMKTAGIYSRLWEQLVEVLTKLFDIKSNIYERYSRLHSTPTWEINFKNNKLVVLNAYVKADMIELSLKLTVDQINEALNLKENLLPYIYQNLENVKSKKSKFVELKIESQQEVDSILEILKNIF